ASVVCAFSTSIESLIAMRFLQALGGCAGMVAAQTLIRDLFPTNRTAQAFSSITLVIAVSPMIAPTVGGYLTTSLGWPSVFVVLAAITFVIVCAVYFVLPEGRKADSSISLKPQHVVRNFITVIREPQFIKYALAGGIAMSAPFAYIAASAHVFMSVYGFTEQQFGWVFAIIASGLIGSAQFNHLLLKYFSSQQLVRYALTFQVVFGLLLCAAVYFDWVNGVMLTAMVFIFFTGQGLTGPNSTALALAPFTKHTGSAASLLGSFRMAIGGLVTVAVSAWHTQDALPMVVTMVMCVVTGLFILGFGKLVVLYKARKREVEEEPSVLM
ncbi:MAG: MFS transporter, partial [Bacteroidota bacterium]